LLREKENLRDYETKTFPMKIENFSGVAKKRNESVFEENLIQGFIMTHLRKEKKEI